MARTSEEERLIRRTKLYEGLCRGKTLRAMREQLRVSEPTILADLEAIRPDLERWCAEQQSQALTMAMGTYQRIIDRSFAMADWEHKTLKEVIAGTYDRITYLPAPDGGDPLEEHKPPMFRAQTAAHHKAAESAMDKLTKLAGLVVERVKVEAEIETTLTHEVEDLDDAFNRIGDPAERAAFIERIRAADEAARVAEEALANIGLPGAE